ncbi:MAG: twin-arginine translocation signal domain-containing protein [Myxococcota bacterium]|nr:twin-arginine translocation signal domain-containing protein [Myxococcota bacterium]
MARGLTRRSFLGASAAGVAGLALGLWRLEEGSVGAIAQATAPPTYGDWRDVYRERWAWDRVVRSTHFVNCWYQSHCAWNVYVKDGLVWREEQAAD